MQVEEIFIWEENKRKRHAFRYSRTISNSPRVAKSVTLSFVFVTLATRGLLLIVL